MCPYRTNAAYIRADTLDQLFAARANLKAEDGLSVSYRLLPWKRHVCTVRWAPASLGDFLVGLARAWPVSIDVLRSEELTAGRYGLARENQGWRLLRQSLPTDGARDETYELGVLARVRAAHVRVGEVRFGMGEGELRFEVSGYELDELGPRFQSIYPWQRLDLPVLTGREWLVLDRPA